MQIQRLHDLKQKQTKAWTQQDNSIIFYKEFAQAYKTLSWILISGLTHGEWNSSGSANWNHWFAVGQMEDLVNREAETAENCTLSFLLSS